MQTGMTRRPIAPYTLYGTSTYTNQRLPEQKDFRQAAGDLPVHQRIPGHPRRGLCGHRPRHLYCPTDSASSRASARLRQQHRRDGNQRGVAAKVMSQNFSGSIRVSASQRDGSNWMQTQSRCGCHRGFGCVDLLSSTAIFMPTLADRRQEKIKLFADWQPDERLALQFSAEGGTNKYSMPSVVRAAKHAPEPVQPGHDIRDFGHLEPQWLTHRGASRPRTRRALPVLSWLLRPPIRLRLVWA
jgi:hypothetical protein